MFNNLKETSMKQGTMNILFFILKTKLLKNGEAPILMRITIDGHYEKVRIQRSVLPKQWNSAKGCSKGKGRTAKELNAYIAALSTLTLREHKELILDLTLITPKLLLKWVFGKDTDMRSRLRTMWEEIGEMEKVVNIDYAPVTINRYINVTKKLEKAISVMRKRASRSTS
jgi:transposase